MEAAAYGAMYGFTAIFMAFYWVIAIGMIVVQYVALWKIFVKTGEPGWKCLVPYLSGHTLYKKFWKPVYFWLTMVFSVAMSVLMCIWAFSFRAGATYNFGGAPVWFTGIVWALYFVYAVVAVVWNVKLCLGMARSFGYGGGFAAGLIFLPLVFRLILAFNKDAYMGNSYVKQAAPAQEPWTQTSETEE